MTFPPLLITLAFCIDALVGDPPRLPHPVRLIGAVIARLEALLRRLGNLRLAGVLLAVMVPLGAGAAGLALTYLAAGRGGWAGLLAALLVLYLTAATISARELLLRVREVLACEDLPRARELLSHIVGRDTAALDADGVRRAALETLAENASDGIVAPLFYLGLGGLPLALAYKAVNTLDSMVGYKNEKYAELGRASAKLDDLANYLPARLTGLLIIVAVWLLDHGRPGRAAAAWRIMRRDGRNHASPNSGIPEAALAGALGIQLGGPTSYFGQLKDKPFIGDNRHQLRAAGQEARTIIRLTALLALLAAILLAGAGEALSW
ncbi:adenosylcobinamide-phosphate synthase CbiB [Desulfurivibrio alkaliphilus]|uniref:adenosylcobinamide-phosphate synthase CbiB n=1 Tax=Desulfurivibrio alkaliphilus TaxID=427923 RepID=UPI003EB939E0